MTKSHDDHGDSIFHKIDPLISSADPIEKGAHKANKAAAHEPEVVRGDKKVLNPEGGAQAKSFAPFVDAGMEVLEHPVVFDGVEYRYRVRGTNRYFENPQQFEAMVDCLRITSESQSIYAQRAYQALMDPEMAVFYPNSSRLKSGVAGQAGADKNLKGVWGKQTLNGDYVAVSKYRNHLTNMRSTTIHEGTHIQNAQEHGYWQPGKVPGNQALTQQNLADLLMDFGQDAKALGMKDFSVSLKPSTAESYLIFDAPWQYFEEGLKKGLEKQGIKLTEKEFNTLVKNAKGDLLKGQLPHDRYYTEGLRKAVNAGEIAMAEEMVPLWAEADLRRPGIVQEMVPNSDAYLDTLYDKKVFNFASETADAIPKKPGLYSKAKAVAENIMHHKHFPKGLIFMDWVTHLAAEKWHGADWPSTLVDGTFRTGVDAAVYGPLFYAISSAAGGPMALSIATLGGVAEFIPDNVDTSNIQHWQDRMEDTDVKKMMSMDWGSEFPAIPLVDPNAIKQTFTAPRQLGDWLCDQFDTYCPNARPAATAVLFGTTLLHEQTAIMEMNETLKQMGMPTLPVKSPEEIQQEIETYKKSKHKQPKDKKIDDKGKEEH